MGPKVVLINSAEETAREIHEVLQQRNDWAGQDKIPVHRFSAAVIP